jgi:hypothetical protein
MIAACRAGSTHVERAAYPADLEFSGLNDVLDYAVKLLLDPRAVRSLLCLSRKRTNQQPRQQSQNLRQTRLTLPNSLLQVTGGEPLEPFGSHLNVSGQSPYGKTRNVSSLEVM